MKRTTNILLHLTLTLLMTGCGGHSPIEPDPVGAEGRPIQFGITSHLEVESKAVIDGENYKNHSFTALGNLTVDEVQQTDLFGTTGATVLYDDATTAWTYSPLRYWQTGSYFFAGVMPSEAGAASFTETNELTLTFASGGFNLAEAQADLMVAFDSQDVQSTSAARQVDFDFQHQLALLNIEVQIADSPLGIVINNIKIYGNHKIATAAKFTTNDDDQITAAWTLGSITTATGPYHQVDGTKIENLLVFPESGSDKLTVAVTYTEIYGTSTFDKTKCGEIDINWQAGKVYTYKTNLTSESIVFGTPTVTDWSNGGAADNIPQM